MASAAFAAASADRAAVTAACMTADWPERIPEAMPLVMAVPIPRALLVTTDLCAAS